MSKNIHLLIIDPQIDFCMPDGNLYVKGADSDMDRVVKYIYRKSDDISRITVTMDSHKNYHIASPNFWVDENGKHPAPYTIITEKDIDRGRWRAYNNEHRGWGVKYVKQLEKNGRYQLCIWPYHCIIGTPGSNIYPPLVKALQFFENERGKRVDYINKGSNSLTEHYSALFADVPVPMDISTQINKSFLISIAESDNIFVAGEALSHCVANTLIDIGVSLNHDLNKFTLLKDATSNVEGFEQLGEDFIQIAINMGLKTTTIAEELNG